jgi:hypothetical protein
LEWTESEVKSAQSNHLLGKRRNRLCGFEVSGLRRFQRHIRKSDNIAGIAEETLIGKLSVAMIAKRVPRAPRAENRRCDDAESHY